MAVVIYFTFFHIGSNPDLLLSMLWNVVVTGTIDRNDTLARSMPTRRIGLDNECSAPLTQTLSSARHEAIFATVKFDRNNYD